MLIDFFVELVKVKWYNFIIVGEEERVMCMIEKINENKNFILLSIGVLLIFLSFTLLFYDRYEYIKNGIFADIALKKYNEIQSTDKENDAENSYDNNSGGNQNVEIDTEYIEDETDDDFGDNDNTSENTDSINNSSGIPTKEYIGFLEIKKINLKVGLVSKNSKYNNVNRTIEILKPSDYPNVTNGNLILASHSGTSKISYFKHLYKLTLNDVASVYYKEYVYHYKIVDIYNVPKTGSLEVKRNSQKTVMTLITCTKDSKTLQTVYILELFSKTRNGEMNG